MSHIIEYIKQKWIYISFLGINKPMPVSLQKRIALSNRIGLLSFILLFLWLIILTIKFTRLNPVNFLSVLSLLSIPYLNYKGFYKFTTFTMSVAFPVLTLFFSILSKNEFVNSTDLIFYFFSRFLILAELIFPMILIDYKNLKLLCVAILINLLCLILFDPLHELFHVGFNQTNCLSEKYYFINYFLLIPYTILLLGLLFLQNINLMHEKIILNLVDELKEKNSDLEQQKEEIKAQAENLEKANSEITYQRDEIERSHKEITSSINYAKRIQNAVLPTHELISSIFPEHFIFYKPRDIVSGDFYFVKKYKNYVFFAVADCTGHGVPGAFMSMLGIAFLNELIRTQDILNPAQLLDELRNQVKNSLHQTGQTGEQQDGMDIAFTIINLEHYTLNFSGANNSLIIFRNKKLIELKADKMPVGIYRNEQSFTNTEFELLQNDVIYFYSDGYYSQFKQTTKETMKKKRFKDLLTDIHIFNFNTQNQKIEEYLNEWKGDEQQVDDILIIGIKITDSETSYEF